MAGIVLGMNGTLFAWWAPYVGWWGRTTIQAREMLAEIFNFWWINKYVAGFHIHTRSFVDNTCVVGATLKGYSNKHGLDWLMSNARDAMRAKESWMTGHFIAARVRTGDHAPQGSGRTLPGRPADRHNRHCRRAHPSSRPAGGFSYMDRGNIR